jgi:hypothetical protein
MRWRLERGTVSAWIPLVTVWAIVAIAVRVGLWNHIAWRPPPPTPEPAWSWNDDVRLDVCLSLQGAQGTSVLGEANLQIEGTLLGSGALPPGGRQPMDAGNVIGCVDEPQRYIEVEDVDRRTWRIMYALTALDPSPLPEQTLDTLPTPRATPALRAPATLRARVGSHVRFRFDAADYAGKLAWFMLLDESGPLIGVEAGWSSLRAGDGGPFAIRWGRPFGRRTDECGGSIARALEISGDTQVSVPPGETRSVALRGTQYRFMNVHSIAVPQPSCTDDGDWISWVLWRE